MPDTTPDLILTNARVYTGNGEASAVALGGERILAVGESAAIDALRADTTRVLDLQGRRVMPGFIDAHVHFITGGFDGLSCDLRGTIGEADFAARLAAAAASRPAGGWITGGGWDHEAWPERSYPHRRNVDGKVPDHPVMVRRTDGHIAFANGAALRLAGVTRNTPDPRGGVIVRDADGEPTGVLKDAAMNLVLAAIPAPSFASRVLAARSALELAGRKGVTTVHDMGECADFAVYEHLRARDELSVRVRFYFPMAAREQAFAAKERGDDLLRVCGVKAFADGSLGAGTALMLDPYCDDPGNRGLEDAAFADRERFLAAMLETDRQELQVCVHAIGDRANREVLDLCGEVAHRNGPRDRRLRIEHAQHLTPGDIPRFAALGVIASVQPYHCIDDARWAERRLGPERSRWTYPFRSLLEEGARVAFGSDWFVAPLDPLQTLYAAITRAPLDDSQPEGWVPAEKVSVAEALHCATVGSAYAAFDEERLGQVAPGCLADLVVLADDPLTVTPERLRETEVTMTIVAGRVTFDRDAP